MTFERLYFLYTLLHIQCYDIHTIQNQDHPTQLINKYTFKIKLYDITLSKYAIK